MEGTPQGEQAHDEGLAVAVYERMLLLASQVSEPKIDECARQALVDYPDPPPPTDRAYTTPETPLELKFRHFARTFLGTSADIEVFNQRASFLYDPAFLEYYGRAARQVKERLVTNSAHAVDIGIEGLADFCAQHPEHQEEALDYMMIAFAPEPRSGFTSATTALAHIAQTSRLEFRAQWAGGYFYDLPFTFKQQLAGECLARLDFGDPAPEVDFKAIHHAAYGSLSIERMYHLRNFNRWLAEELDARQRGERRRPPGYERDASQLFNDAHQMLRNVTKHVAELGSTNAERILVALPEPRRGQSPERSQLIALANYLTPQMNETYFKNQFVLNRLDTASDESLPQAFDRILYVLTKELPTYGVEEVDAKHREIISLVGESISSVIALGYLKLQANSPVTVGDIVALFPDADPETLGTIVGVAQERFARQRGRAYSIYFDYKKYSRRGGALRSHDQPGHGFMS